MIVEKNTIIDTMIVLLKDNDIKSVEITKCLSEKAKSKIRLDAVL